MKYAILITARTGSKRLPRKHFLNIEGRSCIQWLIKRIMVEFKFEIKSNELSIVIVTGSKKLNKDFESIYKDVDPFYGDDYNIPLRHSQAADTLNLQKLICVDGDDVLCSTKAMREVYDALKLGSKYIKTIGLPIGMNVLGYTSSFLEETLSHINLKVLETGWPRIFNKQDLLQIDLSGGAKENLDLRFTLDYDCDFDFFKEIIKHFKENIIEIDDQKIIDFVIQNKVFLKNKHINEDYFLNFENGIKKENLFK